MSPLSNVLNRLRDWRSGRLKGHKLYGAIVAQARLPYFYRNLGVADTVEGRYGLVALHLFGVLHCLHLGGAPAETLAQALTERFAADMEVVLREMGVSDLKVPKAMRSLAASSRAIVEHYEDALRAGPGPLGAAIAEWVPCHNESAGLSSSQLSSYVRESVARIGRQPLSELEAGTVDFADIPEKP